MSISLANDKNNKLSQSIATTFLAVENNNKSRGDKKVFEFMMQLEGCENRIAIAKMEYNKLCKESGKNDLLFGKDEANKEQEVKF